MPYPMLDAEVGTTCLYRPTTKTRNGDLDVSGAEPLILPLDHPICDALRRPVFDDLFYEVIQLSDGVPVFWDDHMDRLRASLSKAGTFTADPALLEELARLYLSSLRMTAIPSDGGSTQRKANLKLVMTREAILMHLSENYYPTAQQFQEGVPAGRLRWSRVEPNVKLVRPDYKKAVAEAFAVPGPFGQSFEVLLENEEGLFTEGSRSNLFFVRGTEVLSAPDAEVLKGITRKYVLEAILAAGGKVVEDKLSMADVEAGAVEAAFITASPIDVLPLRSIGHHVFTDPVPELVKEIQQRYARQVAAVCAKDYERFV